MADILGQIYRAVLVQIARDLDKEQCKELQFLCNGVVPRRVKGVLALFCSLEEAAKMSWVDVTFLKERLHEVGREDLFVKLTAFEIKRDLSILLNFYIKKRNGSLDSFNQSSATNAAQYLVQLMECFQGRFDVRGMLRKSGKIPRDLWIQFVNECGMQRLTWGTFSMLVAIAGEIIAVSLQSGQKAEEAMATCISLADELCHPMLLLGTWEDFCTYVEKRHQLVFRGQKDIGCSPNLSLKRQIANAVEELKKTIFFQ